MSIWKPILTVFILTAVSLCREVSYKELVALRANCDPFDTCNTTRKFIDTNIRNCKCDDKCSSYGDCCLDATERVTMETAVLNTKCFQTNNFGGYFVVNKCKRGWKDNSSIKAKCENGINGGDALAFLPATNIRSKTTYNNYYCAICNEDDGDLEFWKMTVSCPELSNATVNQYIQNLTYNSRSRSWNLRIPNHNRPYRCDIKPLEPNDKSALRFCFPNVISTCARGWTDTFIQEKCESYTAILHGTEMRYRNVHCAFCNRVELKDLSCEAFLGREKPGDTSFHILLDINLNKGNKVGEVKSKCNKGEVYDKELKTCHMLSCGFPFLELRNGKCVPKNRE